MKFAVFFIALNLLIAGCSSSSNDGKIKVACAANMKLALDSIGQVFEEKTGIGLEVSANSSGILTTQIKNGAPFDVFVSANMRYPNRLVKDGLAKDPIIYARGRLLLVNMSDRNEEDLRELLLSSKVERIAVANPEVAPYGIAAEELLKKMDLFDELKPKLVHGESIGQVNQYIKTKAVDLAFTSVSFLSKFTKYPYIIVDEKQHTPIEQGVVILKHGWTKNEENSKKFIEYLQSPECKSILTHYGYSVD